MRVNHVVGSRRICHHSVQCFRSHSPVIADTFIHWWSKKQIFDKAVEWTDWRSKGRWHTKDIEGVAAFVCFVKHLMCKFVTLTESGGVQVIQVVYKKEDVKLKFYNLAHGQSSDGKRKVVAFGWLSGWFSNGQSRSRASMQKYTAMKYDTFIQLN